MDVPILTFKKSWQQSLVKRFCNREIFFCRPIQNTLKHKVRLTDHIKSFIVVIRSVEDWTETGIINLPVFLQGIWKK